MQWDGSDVSNGLDEYAEPDASLQRLLLIPLILAPSFPHDRIIFSGSGGPLVCIIAGSAGFPFWTASPRFHIRRMDSWKK